MKIVIENADENDFNELTQLARIGRIHTFYLTDEDEGSQGEWIFLKANEERTDGYECSVCKTTYHTRVPYFSEFNFCPNCGANMRKPNCVRCEHFGKCDGCEKGEEE